MSVFSLSQGDTPEMADVRWYSAPNPRPTQAELVRKSLEWLRVADGHPSDYLWNPLVAAECQAS